MLALPFVFVFFIINFEAGLIVYWITTNVWTIGQQLLVRKLYPKPEPREVLAATESKPARGKPPPEPAGDGKGAPAKEKTPAKAKAKAKASSSDGGNGRSAKAPPPSPRKKKKRSGRRR
jgi:YidC/Oxa1 family membrane protein insertase